MHRLRLSILATMLALTAAAHAQNPSLDTAEQEALWTLFKNGLITQTEYDQRVNGSHPPTTAQEETQAAAEQSQLPQTIIDHRDGVEVTPNAPVLGTGVPSLSGFRKGNFLRASVGNGEFQNFPDFLRPTSKGRAAHVEGIFELTDRWFGFGQYDWFNDPDEVVYNKAVIGIGWGRPLSTVSEADITLGISSSELEYRNLPGPVVHEEAEELVLGVGYRHFFGDRLFVEPRISSWSDDKELTLRLEWDTGWGFSLYGQGLYRDDYSSTLLGTSVYF